MNQFALNMYTGIMSACQKGSASKASRNEIKIYIQLLGCSCSVALNKTTWQQIALLPYL
jgi:hypothetical protein